MSNKRVFPLLATATKKRYAQVTRIVAFSLLILAFQAVVAPLSAAKSGSPPLVPRTASMPTVTLRAASGATIAFVTQNGQTADDVPPQTLNLPHLVLYRNGELTEPQERTLIVEISGIEVPPAGVTVTLEIETQRGDPDPGDGYGERIPVWRESQRIANTSGSTQTGVTASFVHAFDETVVSATGSIPTPTDYFRYKVAVLDADHPLADPLHVLGQDYAFLMESQWIVQLPEVQGESAGAAPDELIVYYCDMFPFQKIIYDPTTWLPRKGVTHYLGAELVPLMVEAFRTQTNEWGFPWYDAWTGYRPGEDAERLSVALADGRTWFHDMAPSRGHAGISIKVTGGSNGYYATLTDGIMSSFHHELFHSVQRNINLHHGGSGDVDGEGKAWQFFAEGMAMLASSVGQPAVEFAPALAPRAYMSDAKGFVGGDGLVGDLNRSYERMNPYHAAIYWRFLYEQCGGMKDGLEDPSAGMEVIRRTLTTLYSGEVVDIRSSSDLVGGLPRIMDRVFAVSPCPFKTHAESLTAFARAIYALHLDGGRCQEPGTPAGCGFFDPHRLYYDPPISTIIYAGAAITYTTKDQRYPAGVESSFGIEFVEVALDRATDTQPLTLEFRGAPGADAEFSVQLWRLRDLGEGVRPQRIPNQAAAPEVLAEVYADGHLLYAVPEINTAETNRLGLIIMRLDTREGSDPVGEYTIVLHPGADHSSDDIPG